MNNLKRFNLDFDKTLPYFTNHVNRGKTLSKVIIGNLDFGLGNFFTLLPKEASIERLYEFSYGGIIPSITKQESNDTKFPSSPIISMDNGLSEFIVKYLNQKMNNKVIFEDVLAQSDDPNLEINDVKILLHKKEVYYLLTKQNSKEELLQSILKTAEVWHFLAVLFNTQISFKNSFINIEKDFFNEVSKSANYIIIGAYDAEGYIFWERNTSELISNEL